jgi:AraC family transcriptional regulator
MKDLNEIRLTEYARLLDETTLPISSAASRVGWIDSRVAASVVSR